MKRWLALATLIAFAGGFQPEQDAYCTVDNVFDQLAKAVQSDFQIYCTRHPGPAQCRRFGPCGDDRFFVEKTGNHRIVFEKAGAVIKVGRWAATGEHAPLLTLSVRLDDDGDCVLADKDGRVLALWQVRRQALEETFFGAPS